jgi:hypothetical protein
MLTIGRIFSRMAPLRRVSYRVECRDRSGVASYRATAIHDASAAAVHFVASRLRPSSTPPKPLDF